MIDSRRREIVSCRVSLVQIPAAADGAARRVLLHRRSDRLHRFQTAIHASRREFGRKHLRLHAGHLRRRIRRQSFCQFGAASDGFARDVISAGRRHQGNRRELEPGDDAVRRRRFGVVFVVVVAAESRVVVVFVVAFGRLVIDVAVVADEGVGVCFAVCTDAEMNGTGFWRYGASLSRIGRWLSIALFF